MTKKELEQVKELIDQVKSINEKLDSIATKLDSKPSKKQTYTESDELRDRGIVNGLMHICTHPNFDDKQYCGALKQLRDLDFVLSPKQIAWILFYGLMRHNEQGESTDQFFSDQINRRVKSERDNFVDEVRILIKQNYKGRADYMAKLDYYLKSKLSKGNYGTVD